MPTEPLARPLLALQIGKRFAFNDLSDIKGGGAGFINFLFFLGQIDDISRSNLILIVFDWAPNKAKQAHSTSTGRN